jgi:2-C-methyl-D-erythritol 2,4-cyclodiphosphate synthase
MRIGQGYDIHPYSDADALTHAVCDALLGAMGEGDLGTRYPSNNSEFKDLLSLLMLESVVQTLAEKKFDLVNLDTVICAQAPKLAPYIKQMQESLARVLQVDCHRVNIKVKSGEGIGMIGRAEGIAVMAVCLLQSLNP